MTVTEARCPRLRCRRRRPRRCACAPDHSWFWPRSTPCGGSRTSNHSFRVKLAEDLDGQQPASGRATRGVSHPASSTTRTSTSSGRSATLGSARRLLPGRPRRAPCGPCRAAWSRTRGRFPAWLSPRPNVWQKAWSAVVWVPGCSYVGHNQFTIHHSPLSVAIPRPGNDAAVRYRPAG